MSMYFIDVGHSCNLDLLFVLFQIVAASNVCCSFFFFFCDRSNNTKLITTVCDDYSTLLIETDVHYTYSRRR